MSDCTCGQVGRDPHRDTCAAVIASRKRMLDNLDHMIDVAVAARLATLAEKVRALPGGFGVERAEVLALIEETA